jgi:hypothetical protein
MSDNEYMVTQKEAADFLNVSTKSISRYRKRGLPYKLILNPVTGKQEVRFRYADLERWDEGRQLLATYARDGEPAGVEAKSVSSEGRPSGPSPDQGFLADLLAAYKEQIELLRDQLEDMREQLARRDRQIDDLMRLMVGLQLEYKPMPAEPPANAPVMRETPRTPDIVQRPASAELFETIELPERFPQAQTIETVRPTTPTPIPDSTKKIFSSEQLSASILQLRRKGKSFDEIARGLNRIEAATLSGQPEWTVAEVRTLLPSLVDTDAQSLAHGGDF